MLSEIRQMAGKVESVEGVAETLTAADAKVLVLNPSIDIDVEMKERPVAMSSLSHIAQTIGRRTGQANFTVEVKGSGIAGTAPEWAKYLQACGVGLSTLKSVAIGAITNGPFQHGETITGAGGGKGRVICNTATGASVVYYVVISGAIVSGEVITGGTSGATATTSGSPATAGNVFEPIHSSVPSLTIATIVDGVQKLIRGARGNVKLNFKAGEAVKLEFNQSGVAEDVTDETLLSGIDFEDVDAPAFMGGSFNVDSDSVLIQGMEISIDNTLTPRDDPNDAEGIKSYAITGRKTSGSFDPEMQSVAGYDFFGKWFAGTAAVIDTSWGSGAGKAFRFFVKSAQYTKVSDDTRNGLAVAKTSFLLNGTKEVGNDEWALLCL
jgi:hypothetical protein